MLKAIAALLGVGTVGTLLGKSGAVESALSRIRRANAIKREVLNPPPGTPLLVSLGVGVDDCFGIGLAEHSGIYLGDGMVAELNGNGLVSQVSLSEFVNGIDDGTVNTRNGTCIFASCDDASDAIVFHPQAALNAQTFIHNAVSLDYSVFGNNCHMFTASCLLGGLIEKLKLEDWLGRGTFSIADLELIVEHVLNDKRRIGWRRVKNGSSDFSYVLTPAKRLRLYKEGKIEVPIA